MHRCLCVDDIVRPIAGELVAAKANASAVALACCCKRFEDPVLDTLWATQSHFVPLLRILLGDLWRPDQEVSTIAMMIVLSISLPSHPA